MTHGVVLFQNFFPALTKIVGTLGAKSRSVEVLSACLKAGMSGIKFLKILNFDVFLRNVVMNG